jgi:DNA-binding response OmpR family regulator
MKQILIIEDDQVLSFCMAEFLRAQEFDVISADDGAVGLALARKLSPDVVFCDVGLPTLNGLEVLQLARLDPLMRQLPIIMVTGDNDQDIYRRAMRLGASDFLLKPVHFHQLLEAANQQCQALGA